MEPIQIFIVIFSLFAFSRVVLRARSRDITKNEFAFWSVVWIGLIFVALIPNLSFYAARLLGIDRGTDVFLYVGLLLLFYLVFRLYVKQEKLNRSITEIVRKAAINGKK